MSCQTGLVAFCMLAAMVGSGCVSSTLESSQFRAVGAQNPTASAGIDTQQASNPVSTASGPVDLTADTSNPNPAGSIRVASEEPSAVQSGPDPAARAQAVSEMRQKAAAGSGQKTQFGALPEPATKALSAQEQALLARDLSQTASQNVVSDEELEAKKRSIAQMRRKAKLHYKDALNRIER